MRSSNKQRLVTVLVLLILLSFCYTCWVIRMYGKNAFDTDHIYNRLPQLKSKETNGYTNGLANQGRGFHIRQHGPYCILYNYIKAKNELSGNDSITLILHGEWMDLKYLSNKLGRWNGPVSLTLFTSGDDFVRAKDYLSYLEHCTPYGYDLRSWLSVNFIMHQDFLPYFIPRTEKKYFENHPNCSEEKEFDFKLNYRLERNLTYPGNLARNVGRLTAHTHYILSMDMDFFPNPGIPELFLKMQNLLEVHHPRKTVFVLPVFEIKYGDIIPERQDELKFLYQKYLQDYLNSNSLYILPLMHEWLKIEEKQTMDIFDKIKREGLWLAYYISVNDYEPFYDESYDRESAIDKMLHMELLELLDYDFYILNMGFILRHTSALHDFKQEIARTDKHIISYRKLMDLKEFLMNFM